MHAAAAAGHGSFLLVESAGGLLSPYASDMTSADLGHALGLPFLLVARNSLGTVNHTALAVSEIRRRGLPLLGIILVDTSREKDASSSTNASLIADSVGIPPLGVLPFLPDPTPAKLAAALEANVDLGPLTAALLPQPSNGYR
jgi:dethiobiotin synthetase